MNITTFLLTYLKKNKIRILILFLAMLISTGLSSLLLPYYNGRYFDNLTTILSINNATKILLILLTINITSLIISNVVSVFHNTINTRIAFDINLDLIDHIQKVPIEYSRQFNSSFLTEHINSDSNVVSSYFINIITQGVTNLLVLFITMFLLWKINSTIFLVFLLTIPIYVGLYLIFRKPIYNSSFKLKNSQSNLFAEMYRQLNDISSIKMNSLFQPLKKDVHLSFTDFINKLIKNVKILSLSGSTSNFIISLSNLIMLFIGGIYIVNGSMTIGKLIIISSYLGTAIGSLQFFIENFKSYQSVKASLDRLINHFNIPKEKNGEVVLKHIELISLRNIKLKFNEQIIFKDFNFDFHKGKIYIITGKNGRGKTSLINLLSGLYNQFEGEITYNNIPIDELDMYEIRKGIFGVAEQNSLIVQKGIIENILFGVKDWDENNLKELIKGFNLQDKVLLNESEKKVINLSGGEAQKSSIIRALLKKPDILIFDEPTSMIDKNGFDFFSSLLKSIKEEKIIIIITHDENLMKISDVSLNLDKEYISEISELEALGV
ncbi:ABC transporter ATP-binding protein [Paenibacillus sp. FSL R7-0179]|uniref:ABC transporter ATP-binding protein n=1 Tax=Paenibacillus sp. FSL R7-0179 TaxID=2921672 RepID=UPI0030FBFDC1